MRSVPARDSTRFFSLKPTVADDFATSLIEHEACASENTGPQEAYAQIKNDGRTTYELSSNLRKVMASL